MSADLANKTPVFQLKASLYTLTTLHFLDNDLLALREQLARLRQQAPKFFNNAPVIVDLQRLKEEVLVDFEGLKKILEDHQLVIVGLRYVPESWQASAKAAGFSILPHAMQGKSSGAHSAELGAAKPLRTKESGTEKETPPPPPSKEEKIAAKKEGEENITTANTMIITQPVRSGQQIYAKDADLIVTSSVSPGAEIIADGNIHVYGALKGRALAGAHGNTTARIFCQELAAELVSVAGHYWLHEDVMTHMKNVKSAVQVFLKDDQLQLVVL